MAKTAEAAVAKGKVEEQEAKAAGEAKSEDELKVVIVVKGDKIMIGVQSPDCDPVYETLTGNLSAALKRLPKLVAEANEKWNANPRYPKANLPEPEKPVTQARTPVASKKKPIQPKFFD